MSSLARRLQIRAFRKSGIGQIPVLNPETGNIQNRLWPRRPGQLAYIDAANPTDVFIGTKHPVLQPIIDILVEDAKRRRRVSA